MIWGQKLIDKTSLLIEVMRFCPICSNFLFMTQSVEDVANEKDLRLLCRHCGFFEEMQPKSSEDALILMTVLNTANNQKQTV